MCKCTILDTTDYIITMYLVNIHMTLVIATVDHANYMVIIVYKNLLVLLQVS